jgi:hypothetical protein
MPSSPNSTTKPTPRNKTLTRLNHPFQIAMHTISGPFLAFLSLLSFIYPAQGSTFLYPPSVPTQTPTHH